MRYRGGGFRISAFAYETASASLTASAFAYVTASAFAFGTASAFGIDDHRALPFQLMFVQQSNEIAPFGHQLLRLHDTMENLVYMGLGGHILLMVLV